MRAVPGTLSLSHLDDLWYRPVVVVLLALAVDLVLGEYPKVLHPVVWIETLVGWLQRLAPMNGRALPFVFGLFMAVAVPSAFAASAWLLLRRLDGVALLAAEVLLLKASFAVRAPGSAVFAVHQAIKRRDLDAARLHLRSLCSRDLSRLTGEGLAAATVQSIAESTSDSFVAPLFFFALFGVPGALFYRAVNTLDSMIGYRGKLEWLGKASARLDDLLNIVPARITALVLLFCGFFAGASVGNGLRILIRDGGATESPNAGRPMAAMAGLLRVLLAKEGLYSLGDARRPVSPRNIRQATVIGGLAVLVSIGLYALSLHGIRVLFE